MLLRMSSHTRGVEFRYKAQPTCPDHVGNSGGYSRAYLNVKCRLSSIDASSQEEAVNEELV